MITLWNGINDGDMLDAIASGLGLVSTDWVRLTSMQVDLCTRAGARAAASSMVYASAKAQYSIRLWQPPNVTDGNCGIIVYIFDGNLVIDQLDTLALNDPDFIDNLIAVLRRLEKFAYAYDRYALEKLRHYTMQRCPGGVHAESN